MDASLEGDHHQPVVWDALRDMIAPDATPPLDTFTGPDAAPAPDTIATPDSQVATDAPAAVPDSVTISDAPASPGPDSGGAVVPGTWAQIPSGSFSMGSPSTEPCRKYNETQHTVTLTRSFWISSTEVTRQQFFSVMAYDPSTTNSCQTNCPVDSVTWNEAAAYCNALSALEKRAACYSCSGTGKAVTCTPATPYTLGKVYDCPGYRLPTEAEWEYAYRAKTTTALYNGPITNCMQADSNVDQIAWYKNNSGGRARAVGGKAPNAWGLYDMAGNVFEWCHDLHTTDLGGGAVTDPYGASSGSSHVLRGGCWGYASESVRAAYRLSSAKDGFIGLRCVRTAP